MSAPESISRSRVRKTAVARPLAEPAFAGRAAEWDVLDAALARAMATRTPVVVTVVGALGIGKTRLVREWAADVKARGQVRVVTAAADDGDGHGLLGAWLRARLGLDDGAPVDLARVRPEIEAVFGDRRVADVAGLLGRFLGVPPSDAPLGLALAARPEQELELASAVALRFVAEDARRKPLVVTLDRFEQADAASVAFVRRCVLEVEDAPLVLVVATRPDLLVRLPEWPPEGQPRIELGPLPKSVLDVMARSAGALGGAGVTSSVPAVLVDRAVVESGGNPFLFVQLLAIYRRHGSSAAATGDDRWLATENPSGPTALSPEDAAQVRVAALTAAERDVLARGAAMGSVFWTGAVVALGRMGAAPPDATAVFAPDALIDEVRRTLDDLEERGYVVRAPHSAVAGDTEWSIRDGAERALILGGTDAEELRLRRRFGAQWLETRLGGQRAEHLESLGVLYEEGGDRRRAAYCYIAAADLARDQSRLERARSLYLRGVRGLDVDDTVAQMDALFRAGDVAAKLGRLREALAHFGEMLRLAWRLDLPAKGGAAHDRIGRLHRALGEYRRALAHLELARRLFEVAGDRAGVASTLDDIGRVYLLLGRPKQAIDCHQSALGLRAGTGDARAQALTLASIGHVLREQGDLVAAGQRIAEAMELCQGAGDKAGLLSCLRVLAGVERDLGHGDKAVAMLKEARRLAEDAGERLLECGVAIELGDTYLSLGHARRAHDEFRGAKDIARRFGARRLVAEAGRGLGEALLSMERAVDARDEARAAFDVAEAIASSVQKGAALRVLAAAVGLGAPGDADLGGARELFDRAVSVLEGAGSELELGRTLAAYAEFERRSGRGDVAKELGRQADAIRARSRGLPPPREREKRRRPKRGDVARVTSRVATPLGPPDR